VLGRLACASIGEATSKSVVITATIHRISRSFVRLVSSNSPTLLSVRGGGHTLCEDREGASGHLFRPEGAHRQLNKTGSAKGLRQLLHEPATDEMRVSPPLTATLANRDGDWDRA
jgi:hypothetical protein